MALVMASSSTGAGLVCPSAGRWMSTPARTVHSCSWSTAAARKVSQAATSTDWLSSVLSRALIFPIVVVLPMPLAPMTKSTCG